MVSPVEDCHTVELIQVG